MDRGKPLFGRSPVEPRQFLAVPDWLELWSFAFNELDLLPERIRDDEDVGEDDGRVEVEPAQGL